MDNDVKNMINAIRVSIQDAYNITKVLERLACLGDDCPDDAGQMYWDIMYDCAKCIRERLTEYSCGYIPVNAFDELEFAAFEKEWWEKNGDPELR